MSAELKRIEQLEAKAQAFISHSGWEAKACKLVREFSLFDIKAVEPGEEDHLNSPDVKIQGYISTFLNTDRQNDIVLPGAFDDSIKTIKTLPMLIDHANAVNSQVGSWINLRVDDIGLLGDGSIVCSENTEHLIKLIQGGHINTLSMGGLFKYANGGRPGQDGKFYIEKVALLEASIVSIPANPMATFTSKSLLIDWKATQVPSGKDEQVTLESRFTQLKQLRSSKK